MQKDSRKKNIVINNSSTKAKSNNLTGIFDSITILIAIVVGFGLIFAILLTSLYINYVSRQSKSAAIGALIRYDDAFSSTISPIAEFQSRAILAAAQNIIGDDGIVILSKMQQAESTPTNMPVEGAEIYPLHRPGQADEKMTIHWRSSTLPESVGIFLIWACTYGSFLFIFAAAIVLWIRSRNLQPAVKRISDLQREATIARTTQMLAHDVRRPFLAFDQILNSLVDSVDIEMIRPRLTEAKRELKKTTSDVEALVADIMEIGSGSAQKFEPISPDSIIEKVIGDIFKYSPQSCVVNISYLFRHNHKVLANDMKIQRVFSNIISNAVEAMEGRGNLWISTKEKRKSSRNYVEFRIGNSGPIIPPAEINSIFDIFYTSNKRDGTGLGLAIAKKIIEDHDGSIRCTSSHAKGTEFIFDIPTAPGQLNRPAANLPLTSQQARIEELRVYATPASREIDALNPFAFLARNPRLISRAIAILVIDRDNSQHFAIDDAIHKMPEIEMPITTRHAATAEQALNLTEHADFDIIFFDLNIEGPNFDALGLIEKLNAQRKSKSFICVHSNIDPSALPPRNEIHAFARRPIDRIGLAKVVCAWLINKTTPAMISNTVPLTKPVIVVAVIDDSIYTLESWAKKLTDVECQCFLSPTEFMHGLEEGRIKAANLGCIIIDYYLTSSRLSSGQINNGIDFAEILKSRPEFLRVPIILSTNASDLRMSSAIVTRISKDPITWNQLQEKLSVR